VVGIAARAASEIPPRALCARNCLRVVVAVEVMKLLLLGFAPEEIGYTTANEKPSKAL